MIRAASCSRSSVEKNTVHPGVELRANLKSTPHRCHLFEVAFVWELTKETIHLPLGCLRVGRALPHRCSSSSRFIPPTPQSPYPLRTRKNGGHAQQLLTPSHPLPATRTVLPALPVLRLAYSPVANSPADDRGDMIGLDDRVYADLGEFAVDTTTATTRSHPLRLECRRPGDLLESVW